jgi:hypothetical protein
MNNESVLPGIFALLSTVLALAVLFAPNLSDAKSSGAFNISLALASGSAGLAVSGKEKNGNV